MKVVTMLAYEVCDKSGREFFVDMLVVTAANDATKIRLYHPGTLDEIDDNDAEFSPNEMTVWLEDAAAVPAAA